MIKQETRQKKSLSLTSRDDGGWTWKEGFIWDFLRAYTGISRMQIYTNNYFSVLEMVLSAWRVVTSIMSYMVRGLPEVH